MLTHVMVGLCGIVGPGDHPIDDLVDAVCWLDTDESAVHAERRLSVGYADHPTAFEAQPATTDDASIWCWGDVLGHEHRGEYTPRPPDTPDAAFCADRFEVHGLPFVAGLNSEFAGVVYDREAETVSLFTDRLGARPVYYARTDGGSVVFSTRLLSLGTHPDVELRADPPFLAEFLTYSRAFGVHTPAAGVRSLPPASVVSFDLDGRLVDRWTYWWPTPASRASSFAEFQEEFVSVFLDAVRERVTPDRDQGLLLSGGSDSRLVLDALDGDVTAFHMNERLEGNREAEAAQRVAEVAGARFEFLERDPGHYPGVYERTRDVTNFNGLFRHAHAAGFVEELRADADELFCGQYSDTVLGGTYVPKRLQSSRVRKHLTPGTSARAIDDVSEYARAMNDGEMGDYNGVPAFAGGLPDPTDVLRSQIREGDRGVRSHGVTYPSWPALVAAGMFYPLSNARTFVFYETLAQTMPTHYPFLDNRVVDLALQLPDPSRYRRDIVEAAVAARNPALASVPHPDYRLPLGVRPAAKHYGGKVSTLLDALGRLGDALVRGERDGVNPDGQSFPTHSRVIRANSFVEPALSRSEARLRDSPYLDYEAARAAYRAHLRGDDRTNQLYALLELLGSPLRLDGARDDG